MEFLAAIVVKLITYAVEKLTAYLAALKRKSDKYREIDDRAKKDVDKLKKAQTADEVDDGIDNALNDL